MKNAFRLFRRNNKFYYLENNSTGVQKSLGTYDLREAEKLLNDDRQATELNVHLGKTYLAHADPTAAKRTWQNAIDELVPRRSCGSQRRLTKKLDVFAFLKTFRKTTSARLQVRLALPRSLSFCRFLVTW
jgi:hypothetical protein